MTVCLASIADSGQAIVVATDQMATTPTVSADHAMVKGDFIGPWFAMWAANEITPIPSIIQRTIDALRPQGKRSEWTLLQTARELSNAYQAETRERAVAEYLSPFGIDMQTFLSNGSHYFGEPDYKERRSDIERYDLDIAFLVAGYQGVTPSIFGVERRGHIRHFSKPGFWAIGAGHALALGALALRRHNTTRSVEETIHAVLEAKFAAELLDGVGRHTTLGVMTFDSLISIVPSDMVDALKLIYEKQSTAPPPAEALLKINAWWRSYREALDSANADQMKALVKQLQEPPSQVKQPVPQATKRGRKSRLP
jgi:hypothetical protein